MAEKSPTIVITGKVRFSYAHVWKPASMEEGSVPKYSVSILIPKTDIATIARIKKAIEVAAEQGVSKIGKDGKVPKNYKQPLRDGDEEKEDDETYAGHYFLSATSTKKPGIVDADRQPLMNEDEFYSGCYGRASLNMYAFNVPGNKGIAAGLNNLQKLEDGERLGGGATSAEDDFADDDDIL